MWDLFASSLSNIADKLAEGIHKNKCKDFNCNNCNVYLAIKISQKSLMRFKNTFKFFNDINKSILLLRKGVYPNEVIDSLGRFNEKTLPEKEEFYSNLTMENIRDSEFVKILKYKIWVKIKICILKTTR